MKNYYLSKKIFFLSVLMLKPNIGHPFNKEELIKSVNQFNTNEIGFDISENPKPLVKKAISSAKPNKGKEWSNLSSLSEIQKKLKQYSNKPSMNKERENSLSISTDELIDAFANKYTSSQKKPANKNK